MTRLRFVHAADLHLDSPFSGLRSLAPEIAETLYQATFETYNKIIELCIEEQVDALLVAGDIFDSADRSLRAQLKFVEGLRRLEKAGIRSFICHGNHDPLDGWEAQLTFPEGCHRFGPDVERVPVFKDEPDRAAVYGISYPHREVRQNLVPQFAAIEPVAFSIGLLHANVDNNAGHDAYAPCTLKDLEDTGIDYWALGHVHTRQVLRQAGPTVVYPGNPQGRHPNEPAARGAYIVEVDDAGQVSLEFRAVDVVRWST
ncbi:MAG: DNA repair exonuclease, partial [Chloroflexi bacterium]|nr:DNA repair exonuclease [Chloroflexota bacterium]